MKYFFIFVLINSLFGKTLKYNDYINHFITDMIINEVANINENTPTCSNHSHSDNGTIEYVICKQDPYPPNRKYGKIKFDLRLFPFSEALVRHLKDNKLTLADNDHIEIAFWLDNDNEDFFPIGILVRPFGARGTDSAMTYGGGIQVKKNLGDRLIVSLNFSGGQFTRPFGETDKYVSTLTGNEFYVTNKYKEKDRIHEDTIYIIEGFQGDYSTSVYSDALQYITDNYSQAQSTPPIKECNKYENNDDLHCYNLLDTYFDQNGNVQTKGMQRVISDQPAQVFSEKYLMTLALTKIFRISRSNMLVVSAGAGLTIIDRTKRENGKINLSSIQNGFHDLVNANEYYGVDTAEKKEFHPNFNFSIGFTSDLSETLIINTGQCSIIGRGNLDIRIGSHRSDQGANLELGLGVIPVNYYLPSFNLFFAAKSNAVYQFKISQSIGGELNVFLGRNKKASLNFRWESPLTVLPIINPAYDTTLERVLDPDTDYLIYRTSPYREEAIKHEDKNPIYTLTFKYTF